MLVALCSASARILEIRAWLRASRAADLRRFADPFRLREWARLARRRLRSRANGSGNGIAGRTERAQALGGTLQAELRPEGGFGVRAWRPVHGSEP
jgi:hypothetical protein